MPDWRDAAAYAPLLQADRSLIAWEWLRRNSAYREAATTASHAREAPERWALHSFLPPSLTVPEARPIWCAECHPLVLLAWADPSMVGPDAFVLDDVRKFATLAVAPDAERLLLSDGYRAIRIDVRGARLHSGAVRLTFQLSGIGAARRKILVLQRFLALATHGACTRTLWPSDPRARRLVLLLRAHDALVAGMDQRTIAGELLSKRAVARRWRLDSPSLRSQAQRLVHAARVMASSGFWALLQ